MNLKLPESVDHVLRTSLGQSLDEMKTTDQYKEFIRIMDAISHRLLIPEGIQAWICDRYDEVLSS